MDHLRQLSARYNAVWMETSQLYETWARRRGLSFYELLVWLRLEVDRAEQLIEYTALYNRYFREVGD